MVANAMFDVEVKYAGVEVLPAIAKPTVIWLPAVNERLWPETTVNGFVLYELVEATLVVCPTRVAFDRSPRYTATR